MKKIAVLVSGRGSNLNAIIDSVESGRLQVKIEIVLSNVQDAYALQIAQSHNITPIFLDPKKFSSKEEYDRELVTILSSHDISLVCLAGFMRILTPVLVKAYKGRIMNIHPSLLPAFPGLHVQKKALEYGVKFAGCTVHFVDEGVDTGPIILQSAVPVKDDDTEETLSARILNEEHKIYSEAIRLYNEGKLIIEGRRVLIRH